jgi:hypothetical protein
MKLSGHTPADVWRERVPKGKNIDFYCKRIQRYCLQALLCDAAGASPLVVFFLVMAAVCIVAGAGVVVYKLRIRSAMHQEIRAIMAQYMPLESQDLPENHASSPTTTNGNV